MARTVSVSLTLQAAGYIAGVEAAAVKTRELGSEAEKLADKEQAFKTLGTAAVASGAAVGIAVAGFVGAGVFFAARFEKAMSQVQAATQESAAGMEAFQNAALAAGEATKFSASEAAGGIRELAKAGVSTRDIIGGGLTGSLNLAAAGEMSVADAASVAATAMTQFGLRGRDVPKIADLLAAAAGKAQGEVSDMAMALKQGGLVASQMGLSLEETTGTLAAFASAGLIGSDAGTSLRTMLLRLMNPTGEAKTLMDQLGISVYDAQGRFVGMQGLAGQLASQLGALSEEQRNATLAVLFGQDAIRGANVLYRQGAEGIAAWTSKVNDSGFAARVAAQQANNLIGDLEKLLGALETTLIKSGSGTNQVLRGLTQGLTNVVNGFGSIPAPVQAGAAALGAATSAALLASGAFLLGVPKVAEFNAALATMGPRAQAAGAALKGVGSFLTGPWGIALGVGLVALLAWNDANQRFQQGVQEVVATLDQATGKVTQNTREWAANQLAMVGAFDTARAAGVSQRELADAVMAGGDQLSVVTEKLRGYNDNSLIGSYSSEVLARKVETLSRQVAGSGQAWTDAKAAVEGATAATDAATGAAQNNQVALAALSGQAQSAATDVQGLADTIRGFASGELSARDAARQFEAAIASLTDSVKQNGKSLDITTAAGRANEAALDGIAKAALNSAGAIMQQTGSQEAASGAVRRGRDELIKQLGQFGITGAAAESYANKLGLIPENINTATSISIDWAAVNAYVSKLNSIPSYKATVINQVWTQTGGPARTDFGQVAAAYRAGGGILPGVPSSRDNMLIAAASGEYVVNARQTTRNKPVLDYINAGGVVSGFASGGLVDQRGPVVSAPPSVSWTPAGPTTPKLPPIYVQNPFTGEYLLARVEERAAAVVDAAESERNMIYRGGVIRA